MSTEFVSWYKEWLMHTGIWIPQKSAIRVPVVNICSTQRVIKTGQEIEQAVFSRRAKCNYCIKLNKLGSKEGDAWNKE